MKADKKTIIAVVLGIVAVGLVAYQFMNVAPSKTPASSAIAAPTSSAMESTSRAAQASAPAEPIPPTGPYEQLVASLSEGDLAFKNSEFRNPMTPLITDPKPSIETPTRKARTGPLDALALGYTLEGIVWNDMEPLAIVNDQVVAVGEQLEDGSHITEIMPDMVRFEKRGRTYFLAIERGE